MKPIRSFLMLCFLTVFLMPDAQAQFQCTGPFGGQAYAFFRESGGRIFVAGNSGIFSSADEGKSWQELSPTPADLRCATFYSVASSGADIYAGSDVDGIYISHDGGNHWTASRSGLSVRPGAPFNELEIAGPNVLAIRPDSGFLFLSQDAGANWSKINPSLGSAFAQFLSSYNGMVFVSTPQGLFQSMDNGMSYTNINNNPTDFGKLVWAHDTVYAATASGIRVSFNQGLSFSAFALTGRAVRDVAVSGNQVYAIVRGIAPTQDSVLYSTDGGQSFSTAPFSPGSFRFTQVNDILAAGQGLLLATDYSIYGTADSGAHWSLSDSGFVATSIAGLAVSGAYVLAGAQTMGVYRSLPDSGSLHWQHSGDVAQQVGIGIQALAAHDSVVHAGGSFGYYRSTDHGATWTPGTAGISGGNIKSIVADGQSSEVWLLRNGDLYYSTDEGASFGTVVTSNLPAGQAEQVMKADTALFVATTSALYKAGSTMAFAATSGISGRVSAVAHVGNTYYAATLGNGLYSSADGATWTALTIPAPGSLPVWISSLIPDSAGTGLLAGTDDGLYANTGGTWQQVGLTGHVVKALALRQGKVFVGTCSGVYSIPYKLLPVDNSVAGPGVRNPRMQVFPNPSRGMFLLRFQAAGAGAARLYLRDMTGRLVYEEQVLLRAGENEIRVQGLGTIAPGVYVVRLLSDAASGAASVVLQ